MSAFADSSALVKLYSDEPGHEKVRAVEVLVVSAIARVEVPAAIWRKERTGELNAADAETLIASFEADWHGVEEEPPRFLAVNVLPEVLDRAAGLTAAQGLRAYDAVQLASALAARAADPGCGKVICFDHELRSAAARSGFALLPPGH